MPMYIGNKDKTLTRIPYVKVGVVGDTSSDGSDSSQDEDLIRPEEVQTYYDGTDIPSDSLGKDGDLYLRTV